jgi:hypothetical protein
VRDAVIDYVTHLGQVSPAIEGRLSFLTSLKWLFAPFLIQNSPILPSFLGQ